MINQDPYVGKYGLRAIEFCKVVESDGFVKVRHQRPRAKGEASSPSGLSDAGAEEVRYVYAGRRWRDPRDEEDMRGLREAWEELAGSSTIFAGQCALERVVRVCEEYRRGWAEYQAGLSRQLPSVTRMRGEGGEGGGKRRRLDEAGRSSSGSSLLSSSTSEGEGEGVLSHVGNGFGQVYAGTEGAELGMASCGGEDDGEAGRQEEDVRFSGGWMDGWTPDAVGDKRDGRASEGGLVRSGIEGQNLLPAGLISSIEGIFDLGMNEEDIIGFVEY